jgi:hypothetical protein
MFPVSRNPAFELPRGCGVSPWGRDRAQGSRPNKLAAMQLLAKMCGWQTAEKHEIEHGYKAQQELIEVIARLRGRGAIRNNQSAR